MPLYEITLEQNYFGQQVINRWNYQSGEIPSGSSGAFKAIVGMGFAPDTDIDPFGEDTIAGKLQALQSVGIVFVQAIAKNLYSVTDFYTYAFPPGTLGLNADGDGLSPTTAVGFASDRTRSDIKRAQKRFCGVPEGMVHAGGVLSGAYPAQWQSLGDTMADVNVVPAGVGSISYTPYVFGRQEYTSPSGKRAYRYYPDEATQLEHIALITAFTVKPETRTQTTRQYGRGS
jgi:hypothetical protein